MKKNLLPPQFAGSAILTTEDQKKFVRTLLPGIFDCQVTRLYKATDPDVGFSAAKFHSLCDKKGPTLTLIKTVAGHTFGGFTTISWDSTTNTYKNDTQSFLFSVDKQTKYPIVKTYEYAIYCHSSYGPIFGDGHTILVYDNSNSNTSSYVQVNNAYNIPAAANGNRSILTDGNPNFQTTEIEVYLVQ
jgi:hypothetical protein